VSGRWLIPCLSTLPTRTVLIAQLAVVILARGTDLRGRTASHARAVASANGRRTGRPSVIDSEKLEHAALLRDKGFSMKEITAKTGLKRTTLYGHLPPHSPAADSVA
jgi:hypothetical protein